MVNPMKLKLLDKTPEKVRHPLEQSTDYHSNNERNNELNNNGNFLEMVLDVVMLMGNTLMLMAGE